MAKRQHTERPVGTKWQTCLPNSLLAMSMSWLDISDLQTSRSVCQFFASTSRLDVAKCRYVSLWHKQSLELATLLTPLTKSLVSCSTDTIPLEQFSRLRPCKNLTSITLYTADLTTAEQLIRHAKSTLQIFRHPNQFVGDLPPMPQSLLAECPNLTELEVPVNFSMPESKSILPVVPLKKLKIACHSPGFLHFTLGKFFTTLPWNSLTTLHLVAHDPPWGLDLSNADGDGDFSPLRDSTCLTELRLTRYLLIPQLLKDIGKVTTLECLQFHESRCDYSWLGQWESMSALTVLPKLNRLGFPYFSGFLPLGPLKEMDRPLDELDLSSTQCMHSLTNMRALMNVGHRKIVCKHADGIWPGELHEGALNNLCSLVFECANRLYRVGASGVYLCTCVARVNWQCRCEKQFA